ncbi:MULTISPECIES: hypothetical protein [Stutzerimonas stutzeri subgroup]|uniref:hypothetical protein n=1 Tax=Stutzerimonas stutzeri subgroup TaxID=578833 RepID=UPI0011460ACB|nr:MULTISPECIES: hypothetical protein [Stutzerimonas stutzeri subgroup]MDH2241528.1 hypothetical protein [Pseudomonas sp. GD03909]MBA1238406.1 hypothetical protein [Stutzerimonas kunmingensis]MCQ4252843.1 hypothetical protein [Stutzerimonas stutzeri]MCQ4261350.1 hypothetical protein [Stutzerimonas stutzeri]QOZ95697.1 hypothetical protein Pstu14405_10270 [Stutzerimonas stutzeri]
MNTPMMILCAVLSIGVVGAGAVLDLRTAERDRAARTTDYNSPNTLLTIRHSRVEAKEGKRKA